MPDTWHSATTRRPKRHRRRPCLHCADGTRGGHYLCTETRPCQDCVDDALTAAEDLLYDSGDWDTDDGPYERDTDLEHPWNLRA